MRTVSPELSGTAEKLFTAKGVAVKPRRKRRTRPIRKVASILFSPQRAQGNTEETKHFTAKFARRAAKRAKKRLFEQR